MFYCFIDHIPILLAFFVNVREDGQKLCLQKKTKPKAGKISDNTDNNNKTMLAVH